MRWRGYEPSRDRAEAHAILRALLARGRVPHALHPGEWDWWTFHRDPRARAVHLIGDGAVAEIAIDGADVAAFGVPAEEAIDLGREHLPGVRFTVSGVSCSDSERVERLATAGFERHGEPWPLFEQSTDGVPPFGVAGFAIRPLAGEHEHAARADAARLAFASTLEPAAHRARYLRFMRSPAYTRAHDIVAVADDGTIAAFAIHWTDEELSLAQFEPVGTHPDYQRRGLARAVLRDSLARLARAGIAHARVITNGTNAAAAATYLAAGFELVDHVATYRAPASFQSSPERAM